MTRKYQNEGGPGIVKIMQTLQGSNKSLKDRSTFFKANILFWLMGATDGHAKNFSIFLQPGGRYELTPLYDVLSTQPNFDQKKIGRKDFKIAMSVGKSNHYRMFDITKRHIIETGVASGLSREKITEIIAEIRSQSSAAIYKILSDLPDGFPLDLSKSIIEGVENRLKILA